MEEAVTLPKPLPSVPPNCLCIWLDVHQSCRQLHRWRHDWQLERDHSESSVGRRALIYMFPILATNVLPELVVSPLRFLTGVLFSYTAVFRILPGNAQVSRNEKRHLAGFLLHRKLTPRCFRSSSRASRSVGPLAPIQLIEYLHSRHNWCFGCNFSGILPDLALIRTDWLSMALLWLVMTLIALIFDLVVSH